MLTLTFQKDGCHSYFLSHQLKVSFFQPLWDVTTDLSFSEAIYLLPQNPPPQHAEPDGSPNWPLVLPFIPSRAQMRPSVLCPWTETTT